jgi:alkyl hydroperoxide reductase subunit F
MYDCIIVGGGPAGMSAAIYMARQQIKFAMFSGAIGGQVIYSSEIENYLGLHESTGVTMVKKFQDHLDDYKELFDLFEGEKVTQIKKSNGSFHIFTEKRSFQAKTVLITTGARHRKLSVPGEKELGGKGVTYCATCDAPVYRDKDIAIVGGGNSAMEAALLAEKYSKKVHMIILDKALKGEGALKNKIEASGNIETHYEAKTVRIEGEDAVEGLVYEAPDGKEHSLPVQGVFIEIGLIPVADFVDFVEKNKWGEIVVDKQNRTSVEGIWAAGDVTDISPKQIAIAVGEGSKAALNIIRYLQSQE